MLEQIKAVCDKMGGNQVYFNEGWDDTSFDLEIQDFVGFTENYEEQFQDVDTSELFDLLDNNCTSKEFGELGRVHYQFDGFDIDVSYSSEEI